MGWPWSVPSALSLVEKYAQTAKPQKRLVKALDFIQTIIMLLNQILKFSLFPFIREEFKHADKNLPDFLR